MTPAPAALNAICAYFTMFPLGFPAGVLAGRARRGGAVLDPFCGRGTTNFAARLAGLPTVGIDASPVATALSEAKLVALAGGPAEIEAELEAVLADPPPCAAPEGEFWSLAFHPGVLDAVCRARAALLRSCDTPARKALRAILLGALHGPLRADGTSSYLSNQAPRTFAPKPRYAVAFWRRHGLRPPRVDPRAVVAARAWRYFGDQPPPVDGRIALGDSRDPAVLATACGGIRPRWIITSPPYYGLRTYVADQWLRSWFLGGPPQVDYGYGVQVSHRGPGAFADDLRRVWANAAARAAPDARLVVRFGAINDRRLDPSALLGTSLDGTPWRLTRVRPAGSAHSGKRQADAFSRRRNRAIAEIDAWARLG